tara:strand:- start:418 stop:564 length:147 start_codon:yes stop_codon:yes gene_type:complete
MGIKIIRGDTYWFLPLDFERRVKPKEYKSPVVSWTSKISNATSKRKLN